MGRKRWDQSFSYFLIQSHTKSGRHHLDSSATAERSPSAKTATIAFATFDETPVQWLNPQASTKATTTIAIAISCCYSNYSSPSEELDYLSVAPIAATSFITGATVVVFADYFEIDAMEKMKVSRDSELYL